MGQSIYRRYHMKLNKALPSYGRLIEAIKNYLNECHQIEEKAEFPAEQYSATVKEERGEVLVSFYSYKSSAPVSLSDNVLNLVKSHINTDPSTLYYYLEEEGYTGWSVEGVYGKAAIALSQHSVTNSISDNESELLNSFHDSLHRQIDTAVVLTDVDAIVHCIKQLEQKAHVLGYANDDVNRFLVPLLRRSDDSVILAGYHLHRPELVLYVMYKPEKSANKTPAVVYANMKDVTFVDYVTNKKHTIATNLMNPKLVGIQINTCSSYNMYTREHSFTHHHKGSLPLFDDNGPFIKVTNKLESLKIV